MAGTLNQDNKLMFFGLYVASGLIGIVGNILIFRTFWNQRRGSYFHMQLAVANILNLASISMAAPSAMGGKWLFGDTMCTWFGVQAFLAGFAEMTFTCLICIECYLATQHKQMYKELSPWVFKLISAGVWLYAVCFSLAPLFGWNRYIEEIHGTSCGLDLFTKQDSIYSYFMTTQTVFLIFAFAAILCLVPAMVNRRDGTNVFGPLLIDEELIKISGSLLLVLGLCCIPFYLRVLWYLQGYKPFFNSFLGVEFSHLSMKLGSAAHPFAYLILSRQFRNTCFVIATGANQEKKQG